MEVRSPWIKNAKFDVSFIILPGIISVIIVLLLNLFNILPSEVSAWSWLLVVVFIDVAHVWSTLFRTYLHKFASSEFSKELFLTPLACWIVATFLHVMQPKLFWTAMAYLAVFHFMRQQYGFLKIYSRHESNLVIKKFESFFIFTLMLYPIIHWHLTPKSFHWFVEGDFQYIDAMWLDNIYFSLYIAFILIYFAWLIISKFNHKQLNWPKNLLLLNTGLVWYFGIVPIDNDWSFTLTNVVNHGVPYMALIYFSSFQKQQYSSHWKKLDRFLINQFKWRPVIFFISLMFLGYFEEFFWDLFVWHEHSEVFGGIKLNEFNPLTVSLFTALLSVPQLTHYVLDGVIWRSHRKIEEFRF